MQVSQFAIRNWRRLQLSAEMALSREALSLLAWLGISTGSQAGYISSSSPPFQALAGSPPGAPPPQAPLPGKSSMNIFTITTVPTGI